VLAARYNPPMPPRGRAHRAVTFNTVRKLALALPDVEESTAYGAPAFKLRGRLMACTATNKAAEPGTLVVCIDFADRDELVAAEPDVYYLKDHYVDYACVLVRLSRIHPDALRDLLHAGWTFANSKAPRKGRRRARQPASQG
jgi:hypothetical protein